MSGRGLDILRERWHHHSFRENQQEAIDSLLEGDDTLLLLPTGGGKSITYQIPAIMEPGIALVISPLIALIKDQVEALKRRGVKALALHSGLTSREIDIALDNAIYGDYKLLYLSPERLKSELFISRAKKMNISFIAVDEAHCISQWGYDFRPDYLEIKELFNHIERVPIIALTATATPEVTKDIIEKLSMESPKILRSSFKRENLSFVVRYSDDKNGELLRIAKGVKGAGIVYVRERKRAEELAQFLRSQHILASSYHAGYSAKERESKQQEWMEGEVPIIVSTNAFGMGIDKKEVRFVCHYDLPDSLEAYYQEAGRAGRDSLPSYALLLWNNSDLKRLKRITNLSFPSFDYLSKLYQTLYRDNEIAYGDGGGAVIRFNLIAFSRRNRLHASTAFYGIKYLESEGIVKLTEEINNPSRVKFLVNRDQLYNVQLKSYALDSLIKSLLRLYEGIFSNYVSIDEELIARSIRDSKASTIEKLERLSHMEIIDYRAGAISPLLIFNWDREKEEHFTLSQRERESREEKYQKRVEALISYVKESSGCRQQSLVSYFGELNSTPCDLCDLCRKRKRREKLKRDEKLMIREIESHLKGSPKSIEELITIFGDESESYLELIREMIERRRVKIENELLTLL